MILSCRLRACDWLHLLCSKATAEEPMLFRSQTVTWACISHELGPAITTCPIKSLLVWADSNWQRMPRIRQRKRLATICTSFTAPVIMIACQPLPSQPTGECHPMSVPLNETLHASGSPTCEEHGRDGPQSKRLMEKASQALRCPWFELLRFLRDFPADQ